MEMQRACPTCGQSLPNDAPEGFCPCCSFGGALLAHQEETRARLAQAGPAVPNPPLGVGLASATRLRYFGDYELLGEIGRGGMGVVYRARQLSLNRLVAVKMLLHSRFSDEVFVKRFHTEAEAAAHLDHPQIVPIYEVGEHEGQPYFSMKLIEGRSLDQELTGSPLPPRRAARLVATMARAVHYAHQRGVLHRDLKPHNILLDAQGEPHLTDFGLAKLLEQDTGLTVSQAVMGSPAYMAPEQAAGKTKYLTTAADVYSLGAVLYALATGKPPFAGKTALETMRQVVEREPVRPQVLNPELDRDLETICLKSLAKEPDRRYGSAEALAEDLEKWLRNEPITARRVSGPERVWLWCRREPALASLIAALVLAIGGGFIGVLGQLYRAKAAELIARRNAYAADMNLVQRALDESDLGRARELLNRHRPAGKSAIRNPQSAIDLRGWEWRYLWAQCQSEERFTLCQYSNSVSAVAFSADGQWLAVRREDGVVALWDAATKRLLSELPAHTRVWRWCNKALAFSPRGPLLAWGHTDANGAPILSLRDLGEQKEIARLPHSAAVVSVAFASDAKVLATLDYQGTVSVWDLASQQVVTNFPTAPVDWARRVAAGRVTANPAAEGPVGPQDSNSPPARRPLTRSKVYTDHYGCVLFSPNGRWLAVGEAEPRIRLLNQITGELREIPVPTTADGITTLAFSPDSQRLAAAFGAGDNDVHVWELASDTKTNLAGHSGWITSLAFSPDGQTLASASSDQTLRLWDVTGKVEPRRLQGNTDEVWALAWSRDGQDLVTGARDGSVRYWDPTAKAALPYAVLPEGVWFWGPAFLPDSKTFLAVTTNLGEVVRWDTVTAQVVERLSFLGTNHLGLDLSTDGRWLAIGDKVGNLQVWNFKERQLVTNMVSQGTAVGVLMFSPHGSMLNGGFRYHSSGHIVPRFWSVADWREISLRGIDLNRFHEPAFSTDERTLAIGHQGGTAAWWDLQTGQQQGRLFDCDSASAVNVAFSLDGRWFGTGGFDGRVVLWDVAARQARAIGRGHRNELHDLAFSPDGQRLIASGSNRKDVVKLWDVETGRDLAALPGQPGWYVHIGFSPDGNTLFAASMEGTALLWRAPSWEDIEAAETKPKAP